MRRQYSRLMRVEEQKHVRMIVLYVVLSLVILVSLLFFGLPLLAKFSGFLIDIRKSNQKVEVADTTPPAPPRFESLSEATNKKELEVKGFAESGATVTLFFNDNEQEVISDSSGVFTFHVSLEEGENRLQTRAKDSSGNQSQDSDVVTVVFDEEEPDLEISSPSDGSQFYGSRQRQVTIQGVTESQSRLTVNDRLVSVDEDGSFLYATTLSEGENKFNIKAIDKAENTTEKSITLHFSP